MSAHDDRARYYDITVESILSYRNLVGCAMGRRYLRKRLGVQKSDR